MKKKTITKFVINALIVLMVFILVEHIVAFAAVPGCSYVRTQMHDFYNEENVDLVFVGPSFVYRGINPAITDEKTGLNTFNLGTSSQKPVDSYYMIKEALRVQPLKYIVLDLSPDFYSKSAYSSQNTSTYLIYDRMESSKVKTEYFFNAFSFDEYLNALLKSSHYDINFSSLISDAKYKFTDDYKSYVAPLYPNEWYAGKGFVDSLGGYVPAAENDVSYITVSDEALAWLDKIISLCKENNIMLIGITSPKTSTYMETKLNYDEVTAIFAEKLSDAGFSYFDYNRSEYFTDFTNEDFMDISHLNGSGAEKLSNTLSDYINSEIGNTVS